MYYAGKDLLACFCYKRSEMVSKAVLVIEAFEAKLNDADAMSGMLGYKK